ncbi:hypothetical protein BaRGS_00013670, partial [Batillaria attramentaria]
ERLKRTECIKSTPRRWKETSKERNAPYVSLLGGTTKSRSKLFSSTRFKTLGSLSVS